MNPEPALDAPPLFDPVGLLEWGMIFTGLLAVFLALRWFLKLK